MSSLPTRARLDVELDVVGFNFGYLHVGGVRPCPRIQVKWHSNSVPTSASGASIPFPFLLGDNAVPACPGDHVSHQSTIEPAGIRSDRLDPDDLAALEALERC